jgi:hypothetical protein
MVSRAEKTLDYSLVSDPFIATLKPGECAPDATVNPPASCRSLHHEGLTPPNGVRQMVLGQRDVLAEILQIGCTHVIQRTTQWRSVANGRSRYLPPRRVPCPESSAVKLASMRTCFIELGRRSAAKEPGWYRFDEFRADTFPSGHASRTWGNLIRHANGPVDSGPNPWPPGE